MKGHFGPGEQSENCPYNVKKQVQWASQGTMVALVKATLSRALVLPEHTAKPMYTLEAIAMEAELTRVQFDPLVDL